MTEEQLKSDFAALFGTVPEDYQRARKEKRSADSRMEESEKALAAVVKVPTKRIKAWLTRELDLSKEEWFETSDNFYSIWHWPHPEMYHPYFKIAVRLAGGIKASWEFAPKTFEEMMANVGRLRNVLNAARKE